jgi:Holliday junction resolvasome RuvABC endonuclease subunit
MNPLTSRIKALTQRVKSIVEAYENKITAIKESYSDYADVSGVTATAADVASGKTFVDRNKNKVSGTHEDAPDGNEVKF